VLAASTSGDGRSRMFLPLDLVLLLLG
jgi:hypothetical protein